MVDKLLSLKEVRYISTTIHFHFGEQVEYPLVCKTKWKGEHAITFPAEFLDQVKLLLCCWLITV